MDERAGGHACRFSAAFWPPVLTVLAPFIVIPWLFPGHSKAPFARRKPLPNQPLMTSRIGPATTAPGGRRPQTGRGDSQEAAGDRFGSRDWESGEEGKDV